MADLPIALELVESVVSASLIIAEPQEPGSLIGWQPLPSIFVYDKRHGVKDQIAPRFCTSCMVQDKRCPRRVEGNLPPHWGGHPWVPEPSRHDVEVVHAACPHCIDKCPP